jgi:hypothetical protein
VRCPGNVHSADEWEGTLRPVVARYQGKIAGMYFRADVELHNRRYAPDRGREMMSAPSVISGISADAITTLEFTALMSTEPHSPMVTLSSFAMISRQRRTPVSPIAPKP